MDSLIAEITTSATTTAGREESVNLRRNGKIARLRKETRDMSNRMIDDGLPARVIIDELGEAGEGLNAQNITNWKQGGYQDHLKTQERIERIRIQTEAAIDILKGTADLDTAKIHEATRKAAAVQLFEAVWGQGPDALLKLVEAEPVRYFRLLNIICNFSNAALAREKFQWIMKQAEATPAPGPAADAPEIAQNPSPAPAPEIAAHLGASSQFKVNQAPENISNDSSLKLVPLNFEPRTLNSSRFSHVLAISRIRCAAVASILANSPSFSLFLANSRMKFLPLRSQLGTASFQARSSSAAISFYKIEVKQGRYPS